MISTEKFNYRAVPGYASCTPVNIRFSERQGIRRWLWPQGYCYHRSSASDQGLAKNPAESCPRTREKILWQTRRHPRPGKTFSFPRILLVK